MHIQRTFYAHDSCPYGQLVVLLGDYRWGNDDSSMFDGAVNDYYVGTFDIDEDISLHIYIWYPS